MKATVLQIEDGYAVMLLDDGTIIKTKTKDRNLMIGKVLNMKEVNKQRKSRFGIALAITAMFVVMLGGGAYAYYKPSYYVSLDVNPGIVMEVNMFERVIKAEAVNEDAEEVLQDLQLNNLNIEDAMFAAVERVQELGYLDQENGNNIMIATAARYQGNAQKLTERLQNVVKLQVEAKGINAEVMAQGIGYEMVAAAKAIEGMTPGKYNIIVNLLGVAPEEAANYVDVPVRELMADYEGGRGIEGKQSDQDNTQNPQDNGQNDQDNSNQPEDKGNQQGNDQNNGSDQNQAGGSTGGKQ